MPTAPSLDSVVCADVARWHGKDFGAVDTLLLDQPISLGFTCVTDFCVELFQPTDTYTKPTEGTDYTLDRDAGTITFLSTSSIAWGEQGMGQESWGLTASFNGQICEAEPECKAITCCESNTYESADATESGQCSNADCVDVNVISIPASGSGLAMPSYVILTASHDDATIFYTVDGSDPSDETNPERIEYTAPFLVETIGTIINASASLDGCDAGVAASVQFFNPTFPFVFSYACDTPDNAGEWDVFIPNGVNDNHWTLQFTLTGNQEIKRLELFQLDGLGNWTTGQVWSTDSPINPFADPTVDFECFPLLIFIAAVQQFVAYQSTLGTYGAGSHTWELYGDVAYPVGATHLFRLDIILGDDTRLSQIISTTCEAVTPPLCPPPATPTAEGKCDGAVDITFEGTVGQPFALFQRSNDCGTGIWEEIFNDVIATNPQTVEASGLTPGCLYEFYISIQEAGCAFKDSASVSAASLLEPEVTISTDKTIVDPNESFTIEWTSNNIGGATCGGCLDGQVSINQSVGCKAGNTSGSESESQAVCGVYTYEITGCNSCGTVVASVQVEVRCAATCDPEGQPVALGIVNVGEIFGEDCIELAGCTSFDCEICYEPAWDGALFPSSDREPLHFVCSYRTNLLTCGQGGQVKFGCTYANCNEESPCMYPFSHAFIDFNAEELRWELRIYSCESPDGVLIWTGIKLLGDNGSGVYTYNGGCAPGPASITVAAIFPP